MRRTHDLLRRLDFSHSRGTETRVDCHSKLVMRTLGRAYIALRLLGTHSQAKLGRVDSEGLEKLTNTASKVAYIHTAHPTLRVARFGHHDANDKGLETKVPSSQVSMQCGGSAWPSSGYICRGILSTIPLCRSYVILLCHVSPHNVAYGSSCMST